MKTLRLTHDDIKDWIGAWNRRYDLYGPTSGGNGKRSTGWDRIETWDDLALVPGVPKNSIKTFYLPQPETLFRYSARSGDPDAYVLHEPDPGTRMRVVLGVRPCDARSVWLNAHAYEEDPYFRANAERTLLVGLSCQEHCSTCFCKWVGGSPFGTRGLDLLLVQVEDGFLIEVLTERGEGLAKDAPGGEEASGEDLQVLNDLRAKAESSMEAMPRVADLMRSKDLMALYNAPFWQGVAEPCINCGACTFLCPTCYCFDIQDEVVRGRGRRIRYWDSCMFPLFTLHASGHNPRGLKVQRVRNRFMHKFKYFVDRFGPVSCVGCGRCIRECPVNIDIREVLRDLLGVE